VAGMQEVTHTEIFRNAAGKKHKTEPSRQNCKKRNNRKQFALELKLRH
jgi:hypothetical protein